MLEKNLYSDFFRSNVLKISIKFNYSLVYFSISVTLLIYHLVDLSTVVSGVLIFLPLLLLLFCEVPPLYLFVFISYIWMLLYWSMFADEHNVFSLYWSFISLYSVLIIFVIAFVANYVLSDMSIRIPAILSFCLYGISFFHLLSFNINVSFDVKGNIVGSIL